VADVIAPQPGPQTAFLACDADIAFYGGAAGSGKTYAAIMAAMQWTDVPGYAAVVFRRTAPELTGGGSVWEESQAIGRALGGSPRSSPTLDWRFPSGALVEMRHLQHESDVAGHQGKQYACVLFEEATHFTAGQFWALVSRMRSTCGVRPHFRGTCNPDVDSFVRELIDWWIDSSGLAIPERSGVVRWFVRASGGELRWFDSRAEAEAASAAVPLSLTFIPARLADNPMGDPGYAARLASLPLLQRQRLLDGNWNARLGAGTVLRREWFAVVDQPPHAIEATCRGWDKAATEPSESNRDPDWTKGAKWHRLTDGSRYLSDMVSLRAKPAAVFDLMRSTAAQDGSSASVAVWQDPGQAGIVDAEQTRKELSGYRVQVFRASADKVTYAQPWAVIAERGATTPGNPRVYVKRAAWTDAFLAACDSFDGTGKGHDDDIDAVSVAEQGVAHGGAAVSHLLQANRPSLLGVASQRGRRGPW
jgi:predicted phage terminase large subunit-like protein